MTMTRSPIFRAVWGLLLVSACGTARGTEISRRIDERFKEPDVTETPDFQKHVVPLLGRLGCNGRSCHGSFQGQGGFRLSLFGYDFQMDKDNLTGGDNPRVDVEEPNDSLILQKPTLTQAHKGGKRLEPESWQYRVLSRWIEKGAAGLTGERPATVKLEVTPREIEFSKSGEVRQLRAEVVWSDGTREDVTPLCRFQTNNDQVAKVDETGLVTAREPGDTHVVVFYDNAVEPVGVLRPVSDLFGDRYPQVAAPTRIDEMVVAKLRRLGVIPSDLCTDAEFLRRVSLDITGSLPITPEVEAFLSDSAPDKRTRKIDELLERPTFAAWWATYLCDITGNNPGKLKNVGIDQGKASREWYDWIHQRIAANVPYDQLIAGIVLAVSRSPDEDFSKYCQAMSALNEKGSDKNFADRPTLPHFWARQNFRTPNERALGFAHAFLGIRIQCAECHKHPFDQWSQEDFKDFTGFFGRVAYGKNPATRKEYDGLIEELGIKDKKGNNVQKELAKMVSSGKTVPFQELFVTSPKKPGRPAKGDKNKVKAPPASTARLLGGPAVAVAEMSDPRTALMDWLRSTDNPYFARAFVNRVWGRYFHCGIVAPTDDLGRANPPSNGPLLDYLAGEFVRRGYDMKWLHREIANSRTYQLSWRPNETNRLDERNFSHAVPRRLPAEVAYDAIRQVTASDTEVVTMQTELGQRAIANNGGQVKGKKGNGNYALQIFGKSLRENNCDCDRSSEPSVLQTIYLQNDNDTLALIEGSQWIADILKLEKRKKPAQTDGDNPTGTNAKQKNGDLKQQLANVEKRLASAREEKDTDRIAKLERRLAGLRRRAEQKQSEPAEAHSDQESIAKPAATFDAAIVIRQAYLRTLNRPPEPSEVERSRRFIDDASSPKAGLDGLLWALLNTKEFIVNH